ncbi:MAG: L-threonylcarbamoyladenylate synthase [Tenacibaculum sp.]
MHNEVNLAYDLLLEAKIILYPTDTVWGIGCDATNEFAVKKIYYIKRRKYTKSLVILVDSYKMLSSYIAHIPKKVKTVLNEATQPTTIVYKQPKNLAPSVVAPDNTVAVRIVKSSFCKELIKRFKKPIVSTSANLSGEPTPRQFSEISQAILNNVDYVVNLQQTKLAIKPSTLLKVEGDEVIVLRE